MGRLKTSLVLSGLLLAAACALPVRAAEETADKDQLYTMLENMGYSVEKKANGASYDLYLNHKSGDLTLRYSVTLSSDNTKIWISQCVANLTDANMARVPWQKLLAANNSRTGACMFEYYEKSKSLYLNATVDNRNVKPAALRAAIDDLSKAIVSTRDLWDEKNWEAPSTVGYMQR